MPKRLFLALSSTSVRRQRKRSVADGEKFEMRYVQAIGAGRAECSSTIYVSNTSEWSQVSRCGIVKNFVGCTSFSVLQSYTVCAGTRSQCRLTSASVT